MNVSVFNNNGEWVCRTQRRIFSMPRDELSRLEARLGWKIEEISFSHDHKKLRDNLTQISASVHDEIEFREKLCRGKR